MVLAMGLRRFDIVHKFLYALRRVTGLKWLESPRVLLVDDDRDICALIASYLESEGFEVRIVNDSNTVGAVIAKWPPDVLLLDVMMPKVNGFELLKELRLDARLTRVRIYMMTSLQMMDDIERAIALGAEGYFVKPVKLRELAQKLAAV